MQDFAPVHLTKPPIATKSLKALRSSSGRKEKERRGGEEEKKQKGKSFIPLSDCAAVCEGVCM